MKKYIRSAEQTKSNFFASPKYSYYSDADLFKSSFDSDELDDFVFNLSRSNQHYIMKFYEYAYWMSENPNLSKRAAQYIISELVDDPFRLSNILAHLQSAGNLDDTTADTILSSITKCFPANKSKTHYKKYEIEVYIELVSKYCKDSEGKSELLDRLNTLLAAKLKWPSKTKWTRIDSDEAFESMWSTYLSKPEDEVNKELQIFPEPSTQGGSGSMVIFDESENGNEPIFTDFQDWCDRELSMAAESKNANEYKQKYSGFVESLISENWR